MKCFVCGQEHNAQECPKCAFPAIEIIGGPSSSAQKQLEILARYGYRVVSVDELLAASPFTDAVDENAAALLEKGWCVAFRDNTLRRDTVLTKGALAMMAYGQEGIQKRIDLIARKKAPAMGIKPSHPYAGAIAIAAYIYLYRG